MRNKLQAHRTGAAFAIFWLGLFALGIGGGVTFWALSYWAIGKPKAALSE